MGDKARFRVSDVFLPASPGAFPALAGNAEIEGTIIDFSDSGPNARYFAVIEVVSTQSLIVPVQRLEIFEASPPERRF